MYFLLKIYINIYCYLLNNMIEPNTNLCASIKSKKENNTQCQLKRKINTNYCGRHQNNTILYEDIFKKKCECNQIEDDSNKIILSKDELMYHIETKKTLSIYTLRQSIKQCYLKNFIITKQSKSKLIECLKDSLKKERQYLNHENIIIKIQSCIRMFLKKRRYECFNEIDILNMDTKMDIESPYFYRLAHQNKYFAYDIRSLNALLKSNYPKCPYTFVDFSDEQKNTIKMYINKLSQENIKVEEEVILNEYQIIENRIKDLFYNINMLDNYTSHKWFNDLNLSQLIKLYVCCEDIWNYRSQLSTLAKRNIVGVNSIFNIPIMIIKKERSLKRMRLILLNIFERMISNGIDIHEKKLGAIFVLSALVEVSSEAAYALPHLIQV
jgi:hypothetical protein